MTNIDHALEIPAKYPSKWLLVIIALFVVVGPFTTPNGLWFCWCFSASLTYIYINMTMRFKRWEREQNDTDMNDLSKNKKDSKKQK